MTPAEFLRVAQQLRKRFPRRTPAHLGFDQAGGLSILADGVYVGYIDLSTGELHLREDEHHDN